MRSQCVVLRRFESCPLHHYWIAIQAATANRDAPIALLSAIAELGVENALLRAVPNAAHDITAGRPNITLRRTRSAFPANPAPNTDPNVVIKTRKWIHALPFTNWIAIPVVKPRRSFSCDPTSNGSAVAILYES